MGGNFPSTVVCNSLRIMVYVHFTCQELFFLYFKHLTAKLYFAANTHLGRKYPFSLFWGKRTFHCEKHIPDKTSITDYIPYTCILLLFISYVYYTRSHWHFNSLLFIFILLRNFYEHGLVVLRQWGLRFRNIHLRAKKEPAGSRTNYYSWANGAFFCQDASFWSELISAAFCSASTKQAVR